LPHMLARPPANRDLAIMLRPPVAKHLRELVGGLHSILVQQS
jgi:hypothetical protein